MRDEKQRFSLRKLSVGLASVLIGITFLENGQIAKADTITDTSSQAKSAQVVETGQANSNKKSRLNLTSLESKLAEIALNVIAIMVLN